jgi:hypothetical protein
MSYYWDRVLTDLRQSQLTGFVELFEACVSLCEKYAASQYWECAARCHGKFNIAKAWDLG